jgi:hypothetical protein
VTNSPGGGDRCGSTFGFSPEVMTSLATRAFAVLYACSANLEAATKAGSEPGAEWANERRAQGRPMSQRRALSTHCERASPVVRDQVRDRPRHVDVATATIVNTARPEASAFMRAPAAARPGTDQGGLLGVLLARAAPDGSSDLVAIGGWSRSRADQTEPVRAPFGGAC